MLPISGCRKRGQSLTFTRCMLEITGQAPQTRIVYGKCGDGTVREDIFRCRPAALFRRVLVTTVPYFTGNGTKRKHRFIKRENKRFAVGAYDLFKFDSLPRKRRIFARSKNTRSSEVIWPVGEHYSFAERYRKLGAVQCVFSLSAAPVRIFVDAESPSYISAIICLFIALFALKGSNVSAFEGSFSSL